MPVYRDIYDGPPRWYGAQRTTKRYIAIHCTENTASAEAENSYAKRRPDSVSSHYYVDGDSIVQSLDTDLRAFHAGSRVGNDHAIAYEITGLTSWSRQRWLDSVAWPLLVRQMRRDMAAHGIAPRRLTVEQMKAGKLSGIVTHDDMRRAWGGTDHTDPGPNFPLDHLMRLLEEDDVELTDKVRTPDWARKRWPDLPEKITVETALASGYSHARSGKDETYRQRAMLEAILAAVKGQDVVDAVKAELAKHDKQVADRLAEIAALVAKVGTVPAEQIVDEIARRLAEAD